MNRSGVRIGASVYVQASHSARARARQAGSASRRSLSADRTVGQLVPREDAVPHDRPVEMQVHIRAGVREQRRDTARRVR